MTINRSLSRNLSIVAVGVLLVALFSVYLPVANAAAFVVDSTADTSDFSTADGVCDTNDSVGDGPCTLRAALEQANVLAGADSITFSTTGTINVASQLVASDDVTISATTVGDIRIVASTSRNLLVGSQTAVVTPTVSITNLIFTGGNGTGTVANSSTSEGGCIFAAAGSTLSLYSSVVHHCSANGSFGGGIYGDGGDTGTDFSTINLYSSTTVRNNNSDDGGGVYSLTGTIRVQGDACVRNNTATNDGGGLYGGDDTLIVIGGGSEANRGFVVSNYAANRGGGVYHFRNSSLAGNHARFYSNTVGSQGSAWWARGGTAGAAPTATGRVCVDCCIVNNSTNYAVYQDDNGLHADWLSSWWGDNWGPRIFDLDPTQANNQIGSAVSNGDGIRGNGNIAIDVTLADDGNHAGTPIPTGDWDTWDPIGLTGNAPTDCRNFVCNPVSSVSPRGGTVCTAPTSCGLPDSVQ